MQSHEEISLDSNRNENAERQIYVVISIPGLNDWAKEAGTDVQKATPTTGDTGERNAQNNDDSEEMDCSEPNIKKAKITTDNDVNMSSADSTVRLQSVSEDHLLNFPIPIDGGKACIVKVN